jgi:hypothetical protein
MQQMNAQRLTLNTQHSRLLREDENSPHPNPLLRTPVRSSWPLVQLGSPQGERRYPVTMRWQGDGVRGGQGRLFISGERDRKNTRFCETNRIGFGPVFYGTIDADGSYDATAKK